MDSPDLAAQKPVGNCPLLPPGGTRNVPLTEASYGEAGLLWSPKVTLVKSLGALMVKNPGILRKSCIHQFLQIKLESRQGFWPWTMTLSSFISISTATMTWITSYTEKMSPTGRWVLPPQSSGQAGGTSWPDSLSILSIGCMNTRGSLH